MCAQWGSHSCRYSFTRKPIFFLSSSDELAAPLEQLGPVMPSLRALCWNGHYFVHIFKSLSEFKCATLSGFLLFSTSSWFIIEHWDPRQHIYQYLVIFSPRLGLYEHTKNWILFLGHFYCGGKKRKLAWMFQCFGFYTSFCKQALIVSLSILSGSFTAPELTARISSATKAVISVREVTAECQS